MEIRILGCHGSQLPGCNTTSFLLNSTILVDAGTVTPVLTLEEQVNIDYILVTHTHLDHVRDIMFLADNICFLKKDKPLVVLSTPQIIETIRTCLFNGIIWPDFSLLPSAEHPVLKFEAITPGVTIKLYDLSVTAFSVNHTVETVGYVIEAAEGAVIFMGDTGPTDDVWDIANKVKQLKAVFVETSLPDGMKDIADMTGHLTPASLSRELKKLDTHKIDIYLYHMKLQYHTFIQKEISLLNNKNVCILEDGQIVRI
ncbi:MAG: 3',5'-cyclic-nucleotide phosphodiesterase [Deltaproteobacteria bacterium]|nr:3',5'-cyclic-nucleotide phosphodiesterase [Deltaproteobacteria bacterium]